MMVRASRIGIHCRVNKFRSLPDLRQICRVFAGLLLAFATQPSAPAQQAVTIHVNAAQRLAPFRPVYAYFGYDEPNYTYTKNGRKLIEELAALTDTRVNIRTHFLPATGDGAAEMKFGSTNAYTEDASGKAVYDWTVVDRIFDTYESVHAKPFVEVGFMPQALSSKPDPYHVPWIPGAANKDYAAGWSYPPSNYEKWGELVFQLAQHCAKRYGREEAESWYWEVWNEPNIFYWHGTTEEYEKLYDYAAAGLKRSLPKARVGGPATTGPSGKEAAKFLEDFLAHCADGKNFATNGPGAPLDFISYHAKGSPEMIDGHVRMALARSLGDVDAGLKIVATYPKFRNLPIILSEADPEGCAACSARLYPQNAYRNGPLYAAYTAAAMKGILDLSAKSANNVEGMLTWAFEFEGQPYFDGLRTLATNGVDKAVLNFFRMAGVMRGERVEASSSGAIPVESILVKSVREKPDIDVLASRDDHGVSVLVWNYSDEDIAAGNATVALQVNGVPREIGRVLVKHYRIDEAHSNSFGVWRAMGSPQQPTASQKRQLEAAGQLQLLESPSWLRDESGTVSIKFALPRQAVSLIRLDF